MLINQYGSVLDNSHVKYNIRQQPSVEFGPSAAMANRSWPVVPRVWSVSSSVPSQFITPHQPLSVRTYPPRQHISTHD